jgi:hypothetical protein
MSLDGVLAGEVRSPFRSGHWIRRLSVVISRGLPFTGVGTADCSITNRLDRMSGSAKCGDCTETVLVLQSSEPRCEL